MRVYRKELERLKKVESLVKEKFPRLGVNKKQEVTRLLYEISKKGSTPLLPDSSDFNKLKDYLLKIRFPLAHLNREVIQPHLPKIKLDPEKRLSVKKKIFYPKKIFIEKPARDSSLAGRFLDAFPKADFLEISSLKDYLKNKARPTVKDYNERRETAFITYENYDFFKACPCTKKAVGCGYNIFNLSFGCIFECAYCYLQEYTNTPGIIFPANIESFFKKFSLYKRPGMRIGTGEFSDSLMLDNITEYSLPIVDFFKSHPKVRFEFKTKSANIDNLLKANHSGNIIISWSLNPQKIIDKNELFTPSLFRRISLAKLSRDAGYKLGFHFDPVIFFDGWEKEYEKVIGLVFDSIKPKDVAWISIGSLRFNPKVKDIIENRFPENKILDEELLLGFDNKLRYPSNIRKKLYKKVAATIQKHSKKLPVYLCMENPSMWKEVGLSPVAITR
ncbi:radical SAM protein [Candidatus Omnitrophota bacterium]